ncbi:MAG: hypothetical protein ABJD06_15285, partial [Hyphomicrobiales bacterium]
ILGLLERLGLSGDLVARMLFALALVYTLFAGIRARSVQTNNMFVDGYRMTPLPNGLAMAMVVTGALGYSFWPGAVYANQIGGLVVPLGVMGGLALMGALFVPHLRRADVLTPMEFLQQRFSSRILLLLATALSAISIILVLVGQVSFLSGLSARFTTAEPEAALLVILIGVALPLVLGGMRAASWLQMTMAILAGFGFLLFLSWMAMDVSGFPIPYLMASDALSATKLLQEDAVVRGIAQVSDTYWLELVPTNWRIISLSLLGLAVGVSAFPPLLARSQTARSSKESDASIAWAIIFLTALICTLPIYAIFLRLQLTEFLTGLSVADLSRSAPFLFDIKSGLSLCGAAISDAQGAIAACGEGARLSATDLSISPAAFMTIVPDLLVGMGREIPQTISAMLACGALASLIAVVSACFISLAHHLALDLYGKFLGRNAPMSRVVFLVRVSVLLVAVGTYWLLTWPPFATYLKTPETLILAGFAVAAGGLFPVFVLGIWSQRAGKIAACVALLVGSGTTIAVLGALLGVDGFAQVAFSINTLLGADYPIAAAGIPGAVVGVFIGFSFARLAPVKLDNQIIERLSGA